jgi:hypothetical protein
MQRRRTENDMPTHLQRTRLRPTRSLGRWRSIHPDRARDEDLRFFLSMSKISLRITGEEIDELIRPA